MSARPNVRIERLLVEEGFLDGLDVTFHAGLNVVIGHRGVGKTSLIQLLRFCLGGRWAAERDQQLGLTHARSVLGGDGRVSVALRVGNELAVVSRRATDAKAEGMNPFVRPIIFAQGEIESVALDPRGRLRLLDDFIPDSDSRRLLSALSSRIASLTKELADLGETLDEHSERLTQLEPLRAALEAAQARAAASANPALDADVARLHQYSTAAAERHGWLELATSERRELAIWTERLAELQTFPPKLSSDADHSGPREQLGRALVLIDEAVAAGSRALELLAEQLDRTAEIDRRLSDETRSIRARVEATQEGLGSALREVSQLQEQLLVLETVRRRREDLEGRRKAISFERADAVAELDRLRDDRFQQRLSQASEIQASLAPRIEVSVKQSAMHDEYASLVAGALRGSGLKYSQLSSEIASRLRPDEIVSLVEATDVDEVSRRLEIPPDRATRLIEALRRQGLEEISRAPLDDAVTLRLLDGTDYKPTTKLSTGQRCTVVLPILMLHDDRPLLIDQPEDNLDGAFIADTLVPAVRGRVPGSQLIVTTHNANIPVLGEASQVVHLGSDGKRGHVIHAGPLDDPQTVAAISTVMEGGREAFARRARFYRSHGAQ